MAFENLRRWVGESLSHGEPDPKSVDERTDWQTRRAGVGIYELTEKEMDDKWETFEEVPLVREPIRSFATEVVTNGVSVNAGSEEAENELEEWLREAAIMHGEVNRPFRLFVKAVIVQREVRGTAFIEKVRTRDGNLYGFKGLPAHTIKQYSRPGQALLFAPDEDIDALPNTDEEDVFRTDDGDVAAYVQFDPSLGFGRDRSIPFARDEIIKLTRDADFGELNGVSRLNAVEDRIESLREKLDSNDQAIQSLAWKFWLFQFGSDEDPWPEDKIETFMEAHKDDDFRPGMKQGVQGDIDIETIEGEVAEGLEEFLDFDVNWIISAMPLPKFALGGFEEDVNQFVTRSQETRVNQQIQEARQEIEDEFTPILKEKAEELGIDPGPVELDMGVGSPATDFTRPPASSEREGPDGGDGQGQEENVLPEDSVWRAEVEVEDLADPRLVSTREIEEDLADIGEDFLMSVRDRALSRLEVEMERLDGSPGSTRNIGNKFDRIVQAELSRASRRHRLAQSSSETFRGVIDETLDRLSEMPPHIDRRFGFQDRQAARTHAEDFRRAVEDAADQMVSDIRVQARTAAETGERPATALDRVQNQYSEATVTDRVSIITRMEVQNAIETTRLREYDRHPDVVGVEVMNNCTATTTRLCRVLGGCRSDAESITAFFEDGDIGRQIQEQVSDDLLFDGFDPLPTAPPYHWGCTSQLAPIMAGDVEAEARVEAPADD